MTDLLTADDVVEVRQAMTDLADTFAFPITIRLTTYTDGAFESDPEVEDHEVTAIRQFVSSSETDRYRNALGPGATHELDLYVGWKMVEDEGLCDSENKVLMDHNDLVLMEGDTYEVVAFGPVGDMTKKPSFLQIRVQKKLDTVTPAAP